MTKPKSLARILGVLAMGCVVVLGTMALTACGPSPEDQVKDSINQQLDGYKSSAASLAETMPETATQIYDQYGVNMDDYYKALMTHFTYSVGNVTVDGDKATAEIQVQNVDFEKVSETLKTELTEWLKTSEGLQAVLSNSQKAVVSHGMDILIKALEADDAPLTSATETVHLQKDSDGWKFSDGNEVYKLVTAGQADLDSTAAGITADANAA